MIIGLSGKARAGKDLLASIAAKDGWKRLAFADELKRKVREDLGLTIEQTDGELKEEETKYMLLPANDPDWNWLVGIFEGEGSCGCQKAGKSYYQIRADIGQKRLDMLEEVKRITGYGSISMRKNAYGPFYTWTANSNDAVKFLLTIQPMLRTQYKKEQAAKALKIHSEKVKPRLDFSHWKARNIMISYGQFYRQFDPLFWVKIVLNRINGTNSEKNYIITDCRFLNEVEAIKNSGGLLIRLERHPSRDNMVSESIKQNISETALDNYQEFDFKLEANDNHVPEDLERFWAIVRESIKGKV